MAGKQGDSQNRKFIPLESSTVQRGGTRRQGMFCTTETSGYTTLAVTPTEQLISLALEAGATRREFTVWYGVDPVAGTVAVFAEKPGYPGAATIYLNDNEKNASFHLAPVFEKHPDLKPVARIRPVIVTDEDGGKRCLVLQIKGAPPTKVTTRKAGGGTRQTNSKLKSSKQEQAAAEQQPEGPEQPK